MLLSLKNMDPSTTQEILTRKEDIQFEIERTEGCVQDFYQQLQKEETHNLTSPATN
jgi:hypothetical protein